MSTPYTPTETTFDSIGEAASALDADQGLERVVLLGRSVALAEEDPTGRGWLDLHSDAAMCGVRVEVEPNTPGRVWVVRN